MRFAFLVYIGRSGSTFLSRQLDAASQDVLVTPELNFVVSAARLCDAALRALDPDALVRFVRLDPQIRNLGLEPADLETLVKSCAGQGVRALCEALVRAHAHTRGRDPRLVIVKKSVAHLAVEELLAVFPEVVFVHIRRDARGVVNSLVRTESVLDPGHRLGRGDPVHAARLWVRQQASVEEVARRHPERVIELAYEEVLRAPEAALAGVVAALDERCGVELRGPARDASFVVPERERSLHPLVEQAPVEARADEWRRELARADGIAVESIAGEWLARYGYAEHFRSGASAFAIASARTRLWLRHVWITLRHVVWRGGIVLRLLFSDPELARSRVREARFERLGLRRRP